MKISANFLTLIIGSALALVIPLAFSPLLTRLYQPSDFGEFGYFVATVLIIGTFVTGRYELAIITPRYDNVARTLIDGSLIVCTALTLLLTIILFSVLTFLDLFVISYTISDVSVVAGSVWLHGASQVLYYYHNRHGRVRIMSVGRVVQSSVMVLAQILFYERNIFSVNNLFLGYILGQLSLFIFFLLSARFRLIKMYRFSRIIRILIKHKKFPKYLTVGHTLNALSIQLPVYLITIIYGNTMAGYFILTQRVLGSPVGVISVAVSDLFRKNATDELHRTGNCLNLRLGIIKNTFLLGIVPLTIVILFGNQIFAIIFGEVWDLSGDFAAIIAPMLFLRPIASPLSTLLYLTDNHRTDLILQILLFIMVISSFVFINDLYINLILYTASYSFVYLWIIYKSQSFARLNYEKPSY